MKDDAWILLTSVKPNESVKNATTEASMMETMLENRVTPLTQFTLTSDNLTQAIITDISGESEKITKIEDTTLEVGSENVETSSENYITVSSETVTSSTSSEEEDGDNSEVTTFETKPIDVGGSEEETGEEEEEEEEEEEGEQVEVTTDVLSGNSINNISFHS